MDTTVLEAEQLIQRWLDNVESARDDCLSRDADYLSALNWEDGEVGENARAVISGLMETKLVPAIKRSTVATHSNEYDPRVAMEMRHQQVRERRRVRDKKHAHKLRCDELARQVLDEAEGIVKSEEERARAQAKEDELLIQQQMEVIRKQLKQEQAMIKHQRGVERGREQRVKASRALIQAQQLIQSEQKRLQTRAELLRQLEEVEIKEAKEDLRLVHQCFTRWWEVAVEQRAKIRKAGTLWNWRLKIRGWHAWRRFVSLRRERRERDQLARQLQRERRLFQVASEHHAYRVCTGVMCAWRDEVQRQRVERRLHEERSQHRDKMEALLMAAAKKECSNKSRDVNASGQGKVMNDFPSQSITEEAAHKPLPKKATSSTVIWKQARQHLDHVLSTTLPTNTQQHCEQTSNTGNKHKVEPTNAPLAAVQPSVTVKKLKAKPVTKPLAMSGMESRSAAMAIRKALREERKLQVEKERAERLQKEEETKLAAEMEAKETLAAQRREEKRIAKQRELERVARQKAIAELMKKANNHYQTTVLSRKGVWPWKRFVKQTRVDRQSANKLRTKLLLGGVFKGWRSATMVRLREKERYADSHRCRVVLGRIMVAWKQYVTHSKELEIKAIASQPVLLMRCLFRSWLKETRTEIMEGWEKMARARRFRDRNVICQVFEAWKKYVPLSHQEKLREGRRAELRRKVSSWLQDYQPVNNSMK